MKKLSILFSIVSSIYVAIIVFYLLFVIALRFSIHNSIFGYRFFTITDSTMNPKYHVHDVVVVRKTNSTILNVGDDVVFKGKNSEGKSTFFTSRITSIDGKNIVTKGTNFPIPNDSVSVKNVYGKVLKIVPIVTQINHIFKR